MFRSNQQFRDALKQRIPALLQSRKTPDTAPAVKPQTPAVMQPKPAVSMAKPAFDVQAYKANAMQQEASAKAMQQPALTQPAQPATPMQPVQASKPVQFGSPNDQRYAASIGKSVQDLSLIDRLDMQLGEQIRKRQAEAASEGVSAGGVSSMHSELARKAINSGATASDLAYLMQRSGLSTQEIQSMPEYQQLTGQQAFVQGFNQARQ